MRTSIEATRNLPDVRVTLAVLWVAGMLCSLNGDTYRLSDPTALTALLANSGSLRVTSGLLTIMSVLFTGQIFMAGLTMILTPLASRSINRIAGIFYAVIILGFWILGFVLGPQSGYAIVWSTAQLIFAIWVVWYACKWKKEVE